MCILTEDKRNAVNIALNLTVEADLASRSHVAVNG